MRETFRNYKTVKNDPFQKVKGLQYKWHYLQHKTDRLLGEKFGDKYYILRRPDKRVEGLQQIEHSLSHLVHDLPKGPRLGIPEIVATVEGPTRISPERVLISQSNIVLIAREGKVKVANVYGHEYDSIGWEADGSGKTKVVFSTNYAGTETRTQLGWHHMISRRYQRRIQHHISIILNNLDLILPDPTPGRPESEPRLAPIIPLPRRKAPVA